MRRLRLPRPMIRFALLALVALGAAGCSVSPDYQTPAAPEMPGWPGGEAAAIDSDARGSGVVVEPLRRSGAR